MARDSYTDTRRGFPTLALQVQKVLQRPLNGLLIIFRGRRIDVVKVIRHDG
ncbi:IS66 family insertion sequence element accessory protein TnpB [Bradyrhizobium brasilense]|uniref:IS66 family insertion sequence element accessory protein TnpB n=1 Tax=Bradyrhizobium brasilense TaxID=1419277 RepID=UPI003D316B4C